MTDGKQTKDRVKGYSDTYSANGPGASFLLPLEVPIPDTRTPCPTSGALRHSSLS